MSSFSVSSQVSICLNIVLIDILPLNAGALLVIEGLNFFFFKLFYFKYLVGRTESQLWHVEYSSPRDRTQASCIGSSES